MVYQDARTMFYSLLGATEHSNPEEAKQANVDVEVFQACTFPERMGRAQGSKSMDPVWGSPRSR